MAQARPVEDVRERPLFAHLRHGATSRIDVERALINPIAASRGFTPKLLRYLLFQPCAYCRFTSYIAR